MDLVSVKYPFIAITFKFTLIDSGSVVPVSDPSVGQIDLGSVKPPFIAITFKFTLIDNSSAC